MSAWGLIKLFLFSQEDEYVLIAAMDCYIRFSSDPTKEKVQRVVQDCIPTTLIENKSMAKWVQLITAKVSGVSYNIGRWICGSDLCKACYNNHFRSKGTFYGILFLRKHLLVKTQVQKKLKEGWWTLPGKNGHWNFQSSTKLPWRQVGCPNVIQEFLTNTSNTVL